MAHAAVVFDLDGTLWRANEWYARAAAGRDASATERLLARLADGEPVATLLRAGGLNARSFSALCRRVIDELDLVQGAKPTLEALHEEGVPLGAVTNLPRWIVTPMLASAELRELFAVVVDWSTCAKRKPNPDPILYALGALSVEPGAEAWYVGDSADDARAAKAAGISFAWASYGYSRECPLEADRVIADFSEVTTL